MREGCDGCACGNFCGGAGVDCGLMVLSVFVVDGDEMRNGACFAKKG